MTLDFEILGTLVHGAMVAENRGGKLFLSRFTEKHKTIYQPNTGGDRRSQSLASVHLDFMTDAAELTLHYTNAWNSTSRPFFFFDLWENDVLTGHEGYLTERSEHGRLDQPDGSVSFTLSPGIKRVCLYFPELFHLEIAGLEISDGAFVQPVRHSKTVVAFGDSITEGHDVCYAGMDYIDHFARLMGADLYNFGIGGSFFNSDLVMASELPRADIVTAAFGTNDFRHSVPEDFNREMPEFFRRLAEAYPEARCYVILPIWRKIITQSWALGTLEDVKAAIRAEAEKYPNFRCIDGASLVPHRPEFFYDGTLHPNDLGHTLYGMNLFHAVQKLENG